MPNPARFLSVSIGVLSALILTGAARGAELHNATNRPNILFVFTDDQRWDTIQTLGNPEIQTPNLDRPAECGFRFNNAYCMGSMVGAVCLPSRTMLATGLSLWHAPNGRVKEAPEGVPVLPKVLGTAGYVTFHHGKAGNACTFAKVEGKSLLPIIRGEKDKVRDYLFGAYKQTAGLPRKETFGLV